MDRTNLGVKYLLLFAVGVLTKLNQVSLRSCYHLRTVRLKVKTLRTVRRYHGVLEYTRMGLFHFELQSGGRRFVSTMSTFHCEASIWGPRILRH